MIIYRLVITAERWSKAGMLAHTPEVASCQQKLDIAAKALAAKFKANDIQYHMWMQKLTLRKCDKETIMSLFRSEDPDLLIAEVEKLTVYKSRARPPAAIAVPAGFERTRKKVKSMKETRNATAAARRKAMKSERRSKQT